MVARGADKVLKLLSVNLEIFGFGEIGAIGIRGFGMTEASSFGDYPLYVPTVGTGFGFMSHLDMLLEHALTVGHVRTCLRVVVDVWVHAGLHLGLIQEAAAPLMT